MPFLPRGGRRGRRLRTPTDTDKDKDKGATDCTDFTESMKYKGDGGNTTLRNAFGSGFQVRTQAPLCLLADSEPEPDLAVVSGRPRDYSDAHPKTALLVVEGAKAASTRGPGSRSSGSSTWLTAASKCTGIPGRAPTG
jgi:hypothetical protein